jgi:DNA repair exonuclease SbcCD ATPase subunit
MDLEKIHQDILNLEDKTSSKLENDKLLNDIKSKTIILNQKFSATNHVFNLELKSIESELLEFYDSMKQLENDNKDLDESFNVKFEKLELAIKKQDIAKGNRLKVENEIDSIENAMNNIEQDLNLLQINEEDKESLIELENQKQEEIENLKQIKENIATFMENNKEALQNQGGLFIREEFEGSNIINIKALENSEEQIDIALKRLSNIKLYVGSIKQFLISECDKISKEISFSSDLSNKYLATDYLQTSQKFVDSLRSLNAVISVNIHGDMIAKTVIKLIEGLVHEK